MSLRRVRAERADVARAAVPLLLLLVAVAFPPLAGPMLLLLVGGVVVAAGRVVAVAWSWAAAVPAAAIATVRAFGPASGAWDQASCTDLASPPVLWALAEAGLVVGAVAVLAILLSAKPADVGIRRPPGYATSWAVLGFFVILGGGFAVVLLLGGPVLGLPGLDPHGLGFVGPAIVFALALGVSEELAWRGALQCWLARSIGPWPATLAQAALYGVAWGVVLGSPLLGLGAGGAGLLLGATVARTRSLAVALAWHVAFNVPFYLAIACRAPAA